MNHPAFWSFIGLVVGLHVAEFLLVRRHREQRAPATREWTYLAMALPFKATIAATAIEHVLDPGDPPLWCALTGGPLAALGVALRLRGHRDLAGSFSPYAAVPPEGRLVRHGLYARVRHPMYLGSLCLFVGLP
ncbi:MAG: methyltransferase family protein, partial [Planctomycetota bacterium]